MIKKSIRHNFKFYCVGCNRERMQAVPAKVGSARFFVHILVTTCFLSVFTWPWLHFKGIFALVIPVGLAMEAFYRMKMRAALVCPDCHFDPILYMSDRETAVRHVEEAWRKKFAEKGLPYPERKKTPPQSPEAQAM